MLRTCSDVFFWTLFVIFYRFLMVSPFTCSSFVRVKLTEKSGPANRPSPNEITSDRFQQRWPTNIRRKFCRSVPDEGHCCTSKENCFRPDDDGIPTDLDSVAYRSTDANAVVFTLLNRKKNRFFQLSVGADGRLLYTRCFFSVLYHGRRRYARVFMPPAL